MTWFEQKRGVPLIFGPDWHFVAMKPLLFGCFCVGLVPCSKINFFGGDHVLVINLDFCGDWAGSVFPGGEQACEAFVKDPANIEKLKDNLLAHKKYVHMF